MRTSTYIKAFTLTEVLLVMAIMSVLITIVTASVNRFNEQLKVSTEIQQELNCWYRFRANLWREVIHADSLRLATQCLRIYDDSSAIEYGIRSDTLYRKQKEKAWKSTGFEVSDLRQMQQGHHTVYVLDIVWKGDVLTMCFIDHPTIKQGIDSYFERL